MRGRLRGIIPPLQSPLITLAIIENDAREALSDEGGLE
jgi:hypothetical protein